MIYYVMDPTLCDLREWDAEHLEWEGTSVEDAAADAALFWARSEQDIGDDAADLDGRTRGVIAATLADGSDARWYLIEIDVEITASLSDNGPAIVRSRTSPTTSRART